MSGRFTPHVTGARKKSHALEVDPLDNVAV